MKGPIGSLPKADVRASRAGEGQLRQRWMNRDMGISLAFIDYFTMDPLYKLAHRREIFTAPFVYVRFLGNRKRMDAAVRNARAEGRRSRDWEGLILDCTEQMRRWIPPLRSLAAEAVPTYVYFNNHFAGYAPGSVELFGKLFDEK